MTTSTALATIVPPFFVPADGGGFFDQIAGLPVHPLIVHLAVVMLPLAAIALIVIMALPRLHWMVRWGVIAALAVGTIASWIAAESGEALAERVGEPEVHEELGENLPLIAGIALVLGVVWALLSQLSARAVAPLAADSAPQSSTRVLFWLRIAVSVIAAGMAVFTVYYTFIVGHSGAEATWL